MYQCNQKEDEIKRELVKLGQEFVKLFLPETFEHCFKYSVENAHKTVQTMVRVYIKKYEKTWDKLLPLLEFAYNTSTSVSTGYTPFYLHFGRHPIMSIDSYFNIVQRPSMTSTEYTKHIRASGDRPSTKIKVRTCSY